MIRGPPIGLSKKGKKRSTPSFKLVVCGRWGHRETKKGMPRQTWGAIARSQEIIGRDRKRKGGGLYSGLGLVSGLNERGKSHE